MRLQGKVAVITGAASGIGQATAELFAREGAKVVAVDINAGAGREVVRGIKRAGGEAVFVRADVSRVADNARMINRAVTKYGRLDILFNNAGVPGERMEDTTPEKWQKVIQVNLTAPFLATQFAVPEMRKAGGGSIIMTGSTGGMRASGRSPAYTASKGGVILLAKALARILARDNIRVNAVCPSLAETALTDAFLGFPGTEEERAARLKAAVGPLGRRLARAEEVAAAVLFLASDDASFVDGTTLVVDGANTA
ncbi:MAG: SDR family oxidoreductase [Chloroflexota bacterium]